MAPVTVLMTLMGLEIGGAETHAVVLARHLKEMGYRVVMASSGGIYEETIARHGIKHYKVPLDNSRPLSIIRSVAAVRSIIASENVALIHAHARIPAFVSDLAGRLAGIRMITTAHAMFAASLHLRFLSMWGEKTIAISSDVKEHMIRYFGVAESNIILIPNGIDIETFNPALPVDDLEGELRSGSIKDLVVYVSRLDNLLAPVALSLIEACSRLYEEFPFLGLLIVGDGKCVREVAAGAREANSRAGADLVRLLGARTDVNRIMAAGDLIVGVSRVALEAMACGRSVILAGGEGYGGLISEGSLVLFKNDNFTGRQFKMKATAQNIEDSIREFLRLPPESKKQMEIILRNYVVENYSSLRMAKETARVYEKVLNQK
ncbi:MAG: putative glycosyltransferase EpsF [Pelotomaculum sp. PtaU1.Bin035]|nr:MAG: putative glycosyltransferase EpsF [Pelotomaculum sp. PtaU1.Bin035]